MSEKLNKVADSLSQMVIEWVGDGEKDWRTGLKDVIALRLSRFFPNAGMDFDEAGRIVESLVAHYPSRPAGEHLPGFQMVLGSHAAESPSTAEAVEKQICDDIVVMHDKYLRQQKAGFVDALDGLEHMGDFWSLISEWATKLHARKEE